MSLKNPGGRVRPGESPGGNMFGPPNRKRADRRRRFSVSVLVVCAVVAVLVAADYLIHYGEIYPGVEVGGLSVGGMTTEEARAAVEERAARELDEIELTGTSSESFTLTSDRLSLDPDAWGTAEEAYAVGREGDIVGRVGERFEAAWGTVAVPAVVNYDEEAARDEVGKLARRANEEPRDASVSVEGREANVTESREGYVIDAGGTLENLDLALQDLNGEAEISGGTQEPEVLTPAAEQAAGQAEGAMGGPVTLTEGNEEWRVSPEEIGQVLAFEPEGGELQVGLDREGLRETLSDVYDDIEQDPVEASYEVRGDSEISVTESEDGVSIQEEELFGAMESGLFQGQREYRVPTATQEPELTTAQAEELKPTELLGTYRTQYTLSSDTSAERVDNLDIASKAITGTLLAPGEIFSANEILSPLDYNETKVIIEGREEKADGGGLCQVSSTLYMAANYAGLDIVERHPHFSQLPYIRPGLDATVWFGALDMKFENTTDGYLYLREYVADDGYIYAEIYGRPTGKTVEMDSESEYVGSDYSEWTTYQKITDEDGEVIYDDVLHKDTYKPLIDDKGKTVPPNDPYLNVAPVDP